MCPVLLVFKINLLYSFLNTVGECKSQYFLKSIILVQECLYVRVVDFYVRYSIILIKIFFFSFVCLGPFLY